MPQSLTQKIDRMSIELGGKPKRRPPRPNYGRIHATPLPLDNHPLPTLIPHNPLSILHIAFAYLSQFIFRPSSHPLPRITGTYDAASNSVHITDVKSTRLLWERGFFGKGSLSRSEPTWLDREKKRLGLLGQDTSEEYTSLRREERRAMKMERARVELEGIEETRRREEMRGNEVIPQEEGSLGAVNKDQEEMKSASSIDADGVGSQDPTQERTSKSVDETTGPLADLDIFDDKPPNSDIQVEQQEHLQLSPEEAFFLSYSLGILDIYNPTTDISIPTLDLLTLFRSNSYFPPLPPSKLTPYDPFILSYVTYHHFRSLGWVIRPGMKFAVDWLLYLRGPVFAHAEFAVIVLPAFRDEWWWEAGRAEETKRRSRRDWWWLHCLQRVQAQVRKGLVVCWVEVPEPEDVERTLTYIGEKKEKDGKESEGIESGIEGFLKLYKIRDVVFKRWIPNRNRD